MKALIKAEWQTAILVCAKCSKRLDGGFGKKGNQSLAKALRRQLGIKRFRKASIGIVEVKCLGVCPRGAVTLVDAREPGNWRLVPAGAHVPALIDSLGLGAAQPPA
ncbi:hypothetical protein [Sphingomonas sp. 28-63-12]|uniref:hypothetical protein n=1 Tax=Sphingomonas sp. 28-63-12 TaxID=1970434 RepID=UPI000BC67BA3|nr:MAG: hypothetical protein B7Y47_04635 [Sphingomonas sp. 28-63-12]